MSVHTHGTTLSGGTTSAVGKITSISVAGMTRDSIDVSNCDSTNKYREFIPGMIDAGEISLTVSYDKTLLDTLIDTTIGGDAETWTITFPGGSTFVCSGFLTNFSVTGEYAGSITADLTIKLTGNPTWTS